MEQFIDLHMHTVFSDGVNTPEELLEMVRTAKLAAFAVTDHDTIDGYRAVSDLLDSSDAALITGIELSAAYETADLHILAYGFNPDYIALAEALKKFQESRNQRGQKMVEKLNEMGVKITYEDIQKKAGVGVIGRPHVAEAIFESGAVSRYNEAFEKYIGNGGPAYVAKANFAPDEAINLIHEAGGVAVLAHPAVGQAEEHIEMLAGLGLDGVEVFHPEHTMSDREKFKKIAQDLGLSISGGSDYHGRSGRDSRIGSQKVSYEYLKELLEKAQTYQ